MTAALNIGPCDACGRERSDACADFMAVRTVHGTQVQCAWCCKATSPSGYGYLFGDAAPELVAVAAAHFERMQAEVREESYREMAREIRRARYHARKATLDGSPTPLPASRPTLLERIWKAVLSL